MWPLSVCLRARHVAHVVRVRHLLSDAAARGLARGAARGGGVVGADGLVAPRSGAPGGGIGVAAQARAEHSHRRRRAVRSTAAAPRVVALVLLRRPVLSTRVAGVEPYALRLYVDMPLMLTNCSVG